MWHRLRHLIKRVFRSRELDRTLDAEIQSYVAHDIEQRMRAGVGPWEARRQALAEFGSADGVRESVRDGRPAAWVDGVRQDLRYAVRALAKSPGFSGAIIGSLTLGMAAMVTTTAFVNALLFRSFPGVADPETLVEVRLNVVEGQNWGNSSTLPEYQLLRERLGSVKSFAAIANSTKVAISVPAARSSAAAFVSENYFDVLGATAVIGRAFTQEDARPDAPTAAVLSYALWHAAFTGDPAVVGRPIGLGDRVATVIGVMPRGFGGLGQSFTPAGPAGPELWLPLAQVDAIGREMPGWLSPPPRGQRYLRFVARMTDPASIARVHSEANVLASQIGAARAGSPNAFAEVFPLRMIDVRRLAPLMVIVMLVPAVVLLIACVNAANLLLARASQRAREIAIRLAVGASRRRLIRQCIVESLVLAVASSAAALPLAWMVLRALESQTGIVMPLDERVLAATLATACVSAIGFGLVPAFRATNRPPVRALTASQTSDGTPQRTRGRRALVVVQVALSLGLLAIGTHLIAAIKSGDRGGGTDPDRLMLATFDLNQVRVAPGSASQFYQRLLDRVSLLPDVEAVGLAPERAVWTIRYGKQPDNSSVVKGVGAVHKGGGVVLGGYTGGRFFDALGLRVLEGRGFTDADRRGVIPVVAVVNDAFVRDVLKGPAVGQRVRVMPYNKFRPAPKPTDPDPSVELEIVGVVESAREPTYTNRDGGAAPGLYYPVPLQDQAALALYIRTRGPAAPLVPRLRAAFSQVDARVPPLRLETLAEMNESLRRAELMMSRAATILGAIALLLATAGLYAVVSYMVASRSSEIAVRMALGAEPRTVLAMVLRQALTMTVIGGVIGGAVAWAIGRGIQAEMHAAPGTDFKALGGAIAVLLLATLAAAAVPSLRAARINPVALLKEQ